MDLFRKPPGQATRWITCENPTGARDGGGLSNGGAKGSAFDQLPAGASHTLVDLRGSGTIRRIWLTIRDRTPVMLRGLRIDMWWDDSPEPAVSVPLGDFFGIALGRRTPFICTLFSDPEGRSFNCLVPMPFRSAARIVVRNETGHDVPHLFFEVDLTTGDAHGPDMLHFHACWRRERVNALGREFTILPRVHGAGRYLGCNLGLVADARYAHTWWGEGEVKIRLGDDRHPTLVGTGLEDYVGTAWGLGAFAHPQQGCPVADGERRQWALYRHHLDDPVWFDDGCRVAVQTIGGGTKSAVIALQRAGVPLIPVTIAVDMRPTVLLAERPQPVDLADPALPDGWVNFWRQDDWSATAYFYLDSPRNGLPPLPPAAERSAGLTALDGSSARVDG